MLLHPQGAAVDWGCCRTRRGCSRESAPTAAGSLVSGSRGRIDDASGEGRDIEGWGWGCCACTPSLFTSVAGCGCAGLDVGLAGGAVAKLAAAGHGAAFPEAAGWRGGLAAAAGGTDPLLGAGSLCRRVVGGGVMAVLVGP